MMLCVCVFIAQRLSIFSLNWSRAFVKNIKHCENRQLDEEKGKTKTLWNPPPEGKASVGVSLTVSSEFMRKIYREHPEGRKIFRVSFFSHWGIKAQEPGLRKTCLCSAT